jgi:hypothetical protein
MATSTLPALPEGNPPGKNLRVVCAWCKSELQVGTEPTSHGICPECSGKARGVASRISLRLYFTCTVGESSQAVRVEAFRREDGTVGIQHVYTHIGDTFSFMSEADQASILDQARAAFALDDVEEAAVAEGRHVGRL